MNLEELLPHLQKPSRYLGLEFNAIRKDWNRARLRLALVFPDLYEIGMSHQGLKILYHIINSRPELLAERAYTPDTDLEGMLRQKALPMFTIESGRPLGDFDIIGFTLPYELCYTNILTVLELAGIPWRAADRDEDWPLIIGGGSGSFNPEPVAEFFDAILLGDGEEATLEICTVVDEGKTGKLTRSSLLARLAAIPGVYVPSLFTPRYQGRDFVGITPQLAGYETIRRRILPDLAVSATAPPPLVPLVKIVHDRLGIEIARGCTRGCRFCQAGIIYRPVRERPPAQVKQLATEGIAASGFEELALLSLSTGDYACLPELLGGLMDAMADAKVSVSMPSMRVGTLTQEIMEQIKRVRKTGFTVAPEAGTDRLRQVINKGITESDLLTTCKEAFEAGWQQMKLYFMFGLPTETEEDIRAIIDLARKARQFAPSGRTQITVSIAAFVPKPHTPFQWHEQISIEAGQARLNLLKDLLPRKGFKLKWNDPRTSFMEGVFSRGDRRLSSLLEEAWRLGARLDGWSEHFRLETWETAATNCGIDMNYYLRGRQLDEPLPWQHLETGVTIDFLQEQLQLALQQEYTPDCRVNGCQQCGVCDFKVVKPVVYMPGQVKAALPESSGRTLQPGTAGQEVPVVEPCLLHFDYSRLGNARFLGHLELLQVFFQAFRRAAVPLAFSQGFNPTPKVTFSPALPVGTESLVEYLDAELTEIPADLESLLAAVNRQLPPGLEINRITRMPIRAKTSQTALEITYLLKTGGLVSEDGLRERVSVFTARDEYVLERATKKGRKHFDVRKQVRGLTIDPAGDLVLVLMRRQGETGIRIQEFLENILDLDRDTALTCRVIKTACRDVE